MILSSAIIV